MDKQDLARDLQTLRDAYIEANNQVTDESIPDWRLLRVYLTLSVRSVQLLDSAIKELSA